MTRLGHLFALPGPERRLLFHALPLLVLVRTALWVFPFGILHDYWARALPGLTRPATDNRLPPARITWLVAVASRFVPRAHCLTRAVVGQYFLARAGYPTELYIGVRKVDGRLDAHAWLEHDGVPLFEDGANLEKFVAFEKTISAQRTALDAIK